MSPSGPGGFAPPRDAERLRLLHIAAPARTGGLERAVVTLTSGLCGLGLDLRVAAILDRGQTDHPFLLALRRASVPVTVWELPSRAYARERAAVRELLASFRPTLVHTHGARVDVLDSGVARRLGLPTVTTVHGFIGGGFKNHVYQWLQRRAFRRFDAVVAVSAPIVDGLIRNGVPADRVHLLPNVWPGRMELLPRDSARAALGVPTEGLRIGWIGRLGREKGPDVLLDALPLLGDLPLGVSMIGDGRERAALIARAHKLGVDHRVVWHGELTDAARLLSAFDVFVLSSRTEGTPIVLLEAMAANIPVVATTVGGVPDVISENEALLVPPATPQALADAIRAIQAHPAAARRRAAQAHERLTAHFAPGPWVERYAALYADVIRAARPDARP